MDGPGTMPNCVYSEAVTMPTLPDLQFTVSSTTVCKGETVTLTIPSTSYQSNNIYKWYFAQTAFVANGPITNITYNVEDPNAYIRLEITTPNGCVYTSANKTITVKQANVTPVFFFGSNLNVCASSVNQPQISVSLSGSGSSYQWMNGNTYVATTSSPFYSPTQSGSYWVIIKDTATGCLDKSSAATPVNVTIRNAPQVSISGSSQVCQGNSVTLQGIVTDSNLQYEWTQSYNGGSNTVVQTGNSATPISYTTSALATGTYVYTLRVWSASDPSCAGVSSFTVNVSSPPAAPQVSVTILTCQPYRVQLTVQNPGPGVYNWSNGAFGSDITVAKGGLYQVIYTAPSGCTSLETVNVPHSVEDMMWIFPTGCYDMCPGDAYVIGPYGQFTNHQWQYFGNNQQGGPGNVNPFFPQNTGTYNFWLQQGTCALQSGGMYITPSVNNPECLPKDCKIKVSVRNVRRIGNACQIYGQIFNYGSQAVTVTLTSANGNGIYIPSSITVPAGGSYTMNPILFYPNGSFSGVDEMLIMGQLPECKDVVKIVYDDGIYMKDSNNAIQIDPALTLSPNPATEEVTISYDTGNVKTEATTLYIYDQGGRLRHQEKVSGNKGTVKVRLNQWIQGMYLVNIITTADPLQGKLLKK